MGRNNIQLNSYSEAVTYARELFDDLSFSYASQWKKGDGSRRIIGYLPIYIPREIIHAAGMLPVGIFGAGDRIPSVRGDAYFQSYICHLPRTVIELALNKHMDDFDGFIFPAICDVIRNLSGIFKIQFPEKFVRYLDFPQDFNPDVGGTFYRTELERLLEDLKSLNGKEPSREDLNNSISIYNRNRTLLAELDRFRSKQPHKISATDYYLFQRAGSVMAVEDHNNFLETLLSLAEKVETEEEDRIHVVITGSFCEQPPLGLIKTIENAGCYIVEDDFQLGQKWFAENIPDNSEDPIGALVDSYLTKSTFSSAVYEGTEARGDLLAAQAKKRNADGVIFCAPSFCDPALLDRPILEQALDRHHIKHSSFQYHENLGQFHVIKEQTGTFADMIKLWE